MALYSVYCYEENMVPNEYIKLIASNDVQPTQESIRTEKYSLTCEFYVVVKFESPPERPAVRLLNW
jgi:ABC-type phosphate transport system substrate-binding protein